MVFLTSHSCNPFINNKFVYTLQNTMNSISTVLYHEL